MPKEGLECYVYCGSSFELHFQCVLVHYPVEKYNRKDLEIALRYWVPRDAKGFVCTVYCPCFLQVGVNLRHHWH